MHLDPITGLWKGDDNDYQPKPTYYSEEDTNPPKPSYIPKEKPLRGSCRVSIQIKDEEEYQKWKSLNGNRQWEYLVNYPAVMQAEYLFDDSLDVEIMAKKIVQLLQMGFEVYSASWKLTERE